MKKMVILFTLLPVLAWAFPVHTNRFEFDPNQSTGAFDDFLWRWSGFDDQRAEFLFKDVTVSNVGFRLAYPQRGRTFLDVLPPATTNQIVVITNEVLDVYTNFYPSIYNRVTDRGFTNITETLNYSNGIFLSRSVVTNSSKAGSVQNTTLALAASSVITTQSSPVATTTAYGPYTNAYVQSQNTTITVSNFLEKVAFGSSVTYNYNLDPITKLFANQIVYYPAEALADIFSGSYSFTTNPLNTAITSSYSVVSGVVYIVQNNFSGSGSAVFLNISSARGSILGSSLAYMGSFNSSGSSRALVLANTTSSNIIFTLSSNTGLNGSGSYRIQIQVASTNNFAQSVSTNVVTLAATNVTEFYSPSTQRISKVYSKTETTYSKTTLSIPRTNIPPDGPYFAEVLTYTAGGITNPSQSRTLAKGQVTIENSIYSVTNYAGYTNYPGPWNYLLLDGSRSMAGNLNMGGNAVTNASLFGFTDGSSIAASNVALWNSFIAGTGASLTASTEFDGNVTGKWNSLTLRKNALDNMDYLDFNSSPTGSVQAERMQWDSGRSTVKLGLNANVNLDMGQQLMLYAKSVETNAIAKGDVVYIAGASGDNPTIKRASNASEALSARTIGIAAEAITSNSLGMVVTRGTIYNVNTTNFTQGAALYLGTGGSMQTNLPSAPTHGVFIGTVERVGQNNGQIYVAIQNYQELDELSDVGARSPTTNDLLIYNGTVWTNYARTNLSSIYLPLAGGTLSGTIYLNGYGVYDIAELGGYGVTIDIQSAEFLGGPWTFETQPTIPGYLTSAGALSTYVQLTNLSAIAGSGLGVSAGKLTVTNAPSSSSDTGTFVNAVIVGDPATKSIEIYGNEIILRDTHYTGSDNIKLKKGDSGLSDKYTLYKLNDVSGTYSSNKIWSSDIDGINSGLDADLVRGGSPYNAAFLTNFPASILTVSQGNTNYWRITTAPTNSSAFGQRGQIAVSSSNVFLYNPDALGTGTGRWIRVSGSISWP